MEATKTVTVRFGPSVVFEVVLPVDANVTDLIAAARAQAGYGEQVEARVGNVVQPARAPICDGDVVQICTRTNEKGS